MSTPSPEGTLYIQQKEENERHQCDLAIRKVTVVTMVEGSESTIKLQHHQLGRRRVF